MKSWISYIKIKSFTIAIPLVVFLILTASALSQDAVREGAVVAIVGDIVIGEHLDNVYKKLEKENKDPYDFPFIKVKNELEKADIVVGNLEAPFTTRGEKIEKKFNFQVDPKYVRCLKRGGINIVNLANNHIMDYGNIGLIDTIETLKDVGIKCFGAGINLLESRKPGIIDVNGLKIAFLGFSNTYPLEMNAAKDKPGVTFGCPKHIKRDVREAKKKADFVIVSFHWGAERSHRIKDYQKEYACLAIDSGADVVFGHHPHVLQGIENYREKVIAYSLGNFVFGANWSGDIKESMILFVYLGKKGITYRIVPVDIAEVLFQPQIVEGEEKERLIEEIEGYSVIPIDRDEEGKEEIFNKIR